MSSRIFNFSPHFIINKVYEERPTIISLSDNDAWRTIGFLKLKLWSRWGRRCRKMCSINAHIACKFEGYTNYFIDILLYKITLKYIHTLLTHLLIAEVVFRNLMWRNTTNIHTTTCCSVFFSKVVYMIIIIQK